MKEVDLAEPVAAYLRGLQWDVYQEVPGPVGRADILVEQSVLLGAVEVKKDLSLRLIEQAHYWLRYAHLTWIAVPRPLRSRNQFVLGLLHGQGIGMLEYDRKEEKVRELIRPALQRKALVHVTRKHIDEEHRTFAKAGNSDNHFWSPFKRTARQVQILVMDKPGIRLKDAVNEMKHHYANNSTARTCIAHWIREGLIEGVEMHRVGRHLELYPTGHPSTILLRT